MIIVEEQNFIYKDANSKVCKVFKVISNELCFANAFILDNITSDYDSLFIQNTLIDDFNNNRYEKIDSYLYTKDQIDSNVWVELMKLYREEKLKNLCG